MVGRGWNELEPAFGKGKGGRLNCSLDGGSGLANNQETIKRPRLSKRKLTTPGNKSTDGARREREIELVHLFYTRTREGQSREVLKNPRAPGLGD